MTNRKVRFTNLFTATHQPAHAPTSLTHAIHLPIQQTAHATIQPPSLHPPTHQSNRPRTHAVHPRTHTHPMLIHPRTCQWAAKLRRKKPCRMISYIHPPTCQPTYPPRVYSRTNPSTYTNEYPYINLSHTQINPPRVYPHTHTPTHALTS